MTRSAEQIFLADVENGAPRGLLCLKRTGNATVEPEVMGVLQAFHRQCVGTRLFSAAKELAIRAGCAFMQVKTV